MKPNHERRLPRDPPAPTRRDDAWTAAVYGAVVACLLPVHIHHLAGGEWWRALITGLLLLLSVALGVLHWQGREPPVALSVGVAIGICATTLFVASQAGPAVLLWGYPIVAILFFMLPLPAAAMIGAVFIALELLVLAVGPAFDLLRFAATSALLYIACFVFSVHLALRDRKLTEYAYVDPLTDVPNRRSFESDVAVEVKQAGRERAYRSLLVVDIDHFKQVNDRFGHDVGDTVLREFAGVLQNVLRGDDRIYRYGGEEFVVIAHHPDSAGCDVLAGKLRAAVAEHDFAIALPMRASVGAALLEPGDKPEAWFARADRALLDAKHGGRDQVVVAPRAPENRTPAACLRTAAPGGADDR